MKIRNAYISLLLVSGLFACNKDNFNYPAGTVGSSKIIYFPSVSIKGQRLIIMNVGGTYTEAGAEAVLNGATVQYTTTGSVNTGTPGVYGLTYTASNAQGYTASDWRTVVVIGADVATNDFSGTYLRAATGVTSTWAKTANGQYSVENPGGAAVGAGLHVIVVNYTGTKISIPHQISPDYGEVSSGSEQFTYSPPSSSKFQWIFYAGGYGTGLRTFKQQ